MNRLYERSTTLREAATLDPEVQAKIATHAEDHQLGNLITAARTCCETRSVRLKRPGLLARLTGSADPDTEHRTVALITPRYLVVAVSGEHRGTHVRSIRLEAASLDTPALTAAVDTGVSVTGLWSGGPEPASFHLALGADPDGKAFLNTLRAAITESKTR